MTTATTPLMIITNCVTYQNCYMEHVAIQVEDIDNIDELITLTLLKIIEYNIKSILIYIYKKRQLDNSYKLSFCDLCECLNPKSQTQPSFVCMYYITDGIWKTVPYSKFNLSFIFSVVDTPFINALYEKSKQKPTPAIQYKLF